jgi:hypothetical protein
MPRTSSREIGGKQFTIVRLRSGLSTDNFTNESFIPPIGSAGYRRLCGNGLSDRGRIVGNAEARKTEPPVKSSFSASSVIHFKLTDYQFGGALRS